MRIHAFLLACALLVACDPGPDAADFDDASDGERVVVEGTLGVIAIDDPEDPAAGDLALAVLERDGLPALRVHGAPSDPAWRTGARVRVVGVRAGDDLVDLGAAEDQAETVIVEPAPEPGGPVVEAAAPRSIAVIFVNFQDDPGYRPLSAETAVALLWGDGDSVRRYYEDQSFGRVSLAHPDVHGWFTIPYNSSQCDGNEWSTWGAAAKQRAEAAGVPVASYQHVVYAFAPTASCGVTAWGIVGGTEVWIKTGVGGAFFDKHVLAHELGHNLGFDHSNSWRCSGTIIGTSGCHDEEYGDPFSDMGGAPRFGASYTGHITNFQKATVGWLEPAHTTVAGSGIATYTLAPVHASGTALKSVRIPVENWSHDWWYYDVEYRRPTPYDNWPASDPAVNGVLIRRTRAVSARGKPQLLDANPQTATKLDAPFPVGSRFSDPRAGITIEVVSAGPSSAVVRVIAHPEGAGGRLVSLPTRRCLTIDGSITTNGTPVATRDCGGSTAQQWFLSQAGQMRNPGGKCLENPKWSVFGQVASLIWGCHLDWNGQWSFRGGQVVAVGDKCVDVDRAQFFNGNIVQTWDCNGGGAQRWTYHPGTRKLTAGDGTWCLDVERREAFNGARVFLWKCNGGTNQQWIPSRTGWRSVLDDRYCLDVRAGNTANGAPLQLWECNATEAQRFYLRGGLVGRNASGDGCLGADGRLAACTNPPQTWIYYP